MDPIWLYYTHVTDKGNVFRVNIHGKQAPNQGANPYTPVETLARSECFILEYDGKVQEPFQALVGSKVTIPLYVGTVEMNEQQSSIVLYRELAIITQILAIMRVGEEGYFSVTIYRDPDGVNALYWSGTLLHEQLTIANQPRPFNLTFTATCDMANLFNIPYIDPDTGEVPTGSDNFISVMCDLLRRTRHSWVWQAGEPFIVTQRYFNSQSAIADGNADPLLFHKFIRSDMQIERPNGNKQPRNCGEVLQAIAEVFMLSIYLANGRWYAIPRAQANNNPIQYQLTTRTRTADVIGTPDATFTDFYAISDTPGQAVILNGGTESFIHPVNQIRRQYTFNGSLPIINTGQLVDYDDFIGVEHISANYTALEGTVITIRPFFQIQQEGNLARTGASRVIRYKMVFRIKVGGLYLRRPSGTFPNVNKAICQGTAFSTQVSVFNPLPGGFNSPELTSTVTWTTDSADRFDYWTQPIDARCGEGVWGPSIFQLPPLPSDENGVEFEVESLEAFIADGNTSSAITLAAADEATLRFRFEMIVLESTGNTDSIGFSSTNTNNARQVIELNDALFGDQISTLPSRGAIRHPDNTTFTGEEWLRPGQTTPYLINALLTRTHAQHRNQSNRTANFKLYHTLLYFYQRAVYDGIFGWTMTEMRYTAGRDEYDVSLMEFSRLTGNAVQGFFDRADGVPLFPPSGNNTIQNTVAMQSFSEYATAAASYAAEKVLNLQPIGAGGVVLKSAEDSTDAVTYTPPAGVTKSVTMPTSFPLFRLYQARINAIDEERFFSVMSNTSTAIIGYGNEFIAPFDGRVLAIYVRSEVTLDADLKVYINGVSAVTKSATLTAGDVEILDVLADDVFISDGDRIAVSIEVDTQPSDVQVTLAMAGW